ncbi:MAG TPA: type I-E CRISPR-associated protein Cas7/Cse4/CasC [Candidatus Tenderia sp.]|nr:type I-E CRISPR-associated protein Cas7/Cse4/CasC [Candidatus Tenderia sp.]
MKRFAQLHLLTSYPPANLNRDDLGRPKTAVMGGATRLRVSSQSLKRAWRTSDVFESSLKGHVGTRTKEMGCRVFANLKEQGVKDKKAAEWAKAIAGCFGKLKTLSKDEEKKLKGDDLSPEERAKLTMRPLEIEQLAHFSPEEEQAIADLVALLAERDDAPTNDELKLLRKQHTAADISLFGRMLASSPAFNVEAAAQVAHAISVHKVAVEDDFFTAVDDLNNGEDDMGAAHMGETEFAAGLFYQYICLDRALLEENLGGDSALVESTINAFFEAAMTVAPTGKQNSFASRARASYALCEVGDQQPRSLAAAFLKPVVAEDMLAEAVARLDQTVINMDKAYGDCADARSVMNIATGEGSLQDILATATE